MWFAFSDVEWTNDVWKKAQDVKWRESHMRPVDLTDWDKSESTSVNGIKHAAGINEIEKYVTEFSGQTKSSAFSFCADPFAARNRYVDFAPLGAHFGIPAPAPLAITNNNSKATFNFTMGVPGWRAFHVEIIKKAAATGDTNNLNEMIRTMRKEGAFMGLLHQFKRLDPNDKLPIGRKGVILALDDPAGIISDVAAFINEKLVVFDRPYERKLMVSQAIEILRKSVMDQAEGKTVSKAAAITEMYETTFKRKDEAGEFSEVSDAQRNFERTEAWNKYAYLDYEAKDIYADDAYWKEFQEKHPDMNDPPPPKAGYSNPAAHAKRLGWEMMNEERQKFEKARYKTHITPLFVPKPRFSEEDRAKFQNFYEDQLAKFIEENIKVLAVAHAAWVKHKSLLKYFNGFFDPDNFDSGLAFTAVLAECIGHTQSLEPCAEVYDKWLKTDIHAKENLLARGMYFNQDAVNKTAKKLIKTEEDVAAEKLWKEAMKAIEKGAKSGLMGNLVTGKKWFQLKEHLENVSNYLVARLSGVIIKAGYTIVRPVLVLAGLAQSHALIEVSVKGQRVNHARVSATRALKAVHGGSNTRLKSEVEKILNSLPKKHFAGNGVYSAVIPLWISEDDLTALREMQGLDEAARAKAIAGKIQTGGTPTPRARILADAVAGKGTPEQLEELNQTVRLRDLDLAENAARRIMKPLGSSIFSILQMFGLESTYKAYLKTDNIGKETWSPITRLVSSVIGSAGAAFGALETFMPESARLVLRQESKLFATLTVPRLLGAVAAFIWGATDIVLGFRNLFDGKTTVGGLYIATGVLSLVGAGLGLFAAAPWLAVAGVILLVGSVVLSIWLENIKENDTQDWLHRCIFGHAPDYPKGKEAEELENSAFGWGLERYKFRHEGIESRALRNAMGA
jgi:hypothetical protein